MPKIFMPRPIPCPYCGLKIKDMLQGKPHKPNCPITKGPFAKKK